MSARTKFSVTNCNLYNLNLPGLRMYNNTKGWSETEYTAKITWLQKALLSAQADVFGFQELWHTQALAALFQHESLSDYTLLSPEQHEGESIICAAAVKTEILVSEPQWITDFPDNFRLDSGGDDQQTSDISVKINRFSRPVLTFQVRPRRSGKKITVFVTHFKSKRPTDIFRESWYQADVNAYKKHRISLGSAISTIRRTAEATALRIIITDITKNSDTPVIVIGDLNDGDHSNTVNILSGQPNYLLSGLSQGGSDTALYTASTLQKLRSERDVYFTHIYKNSMESLDQILFSQEFYDNSKKRIWAFKGLTVHNDHLYDDNHKQQGSTDHGIIRAAFEYRPNR